MIKQIDYFKIREELLGNNGRKIIEIEKMYSDVLISLIKNNADLIKADFDFPSEITQFWINYPPEQRGRKPVGDSIPWIEVGEKSITANLVKLFSSSDDFIDTRFVGLPAGGDLRFMTDNAFIHIDIKVTGPRDATHEVVASSKQFSGTGDLWNEKGFLNRSIEIISPRTKKPFEPDLPPFYCHHGITKLCIVFFLKAIYSIKGKGIQPLEYLELSCLPNGLLLFDGPNYSSNNADLIIAGKDDKRSSTPISKQRRRLRLNPLARIADWRSRKIIFNKTNNQWEILSRNSTSNKL